MSKETTVIGKTETVINVPIEQVWQLYAVEFAEIGKWSSSVNHSTGSGEAIGSCDVSERACEISALGFSDTKERILEFDDKNYVLRYSLYDGLPGFVTDAENTWRFHAQGGKTRVEGQTVMKVKGLMGWMMAGFMKSNLNRALGEMAEEGKHYLETGQPHPKKVKAAEKYAKRQARKPKNARA